MFVNDPDIMIATGIGCGIVHFVTYLAAKHLSPIPEIRKKPHVLAHQVISLCVNCFCATYGSYIWFCNEDFKEIANSDSYGRLFGQFDAAIIVAEVNVGMQIYDIIATAFIPAFRNAVMVGHHLAVSILGVMTIYPHLIPFVVEGKEQDYWVNYYICFFLGVAEASTIPLIIYDLMKNLKQTKVDYPCAQKVNDMSKLVFAALFLIIRVIYWPIVMVGFWSDLFNMWDEAHNYLVFSVYILGSTFLTILQFHWGFKILQSIYGLLTGQSLESAGEEHVGRHDEDYQEVDEYDDVEMGKDKGEAEPLVK